MGRRKKTHRGPVKRSAKSSSTPNTRTPLPRWKVWCFRLAAAGLSSFVLLAFLELGLRIGGVGYPTSFLLRKTLEGERFWVQNDRFGWRFFGRNYSRTPQPLALPMDKSDETVRIFVLGESAALGDPQPDFGLPRLLEAMLSLRYPDTRFEVANVAMTAINSHAIREIASACAGAEGDIWVVYMGNNEVVGPFGGGTVFGPQVPPLWMIRASLTVKSTRTGQLLEALMTRLHPPPPDEREWGGMQMFLEQQVRAEDPRMIRVYDHFKRNLTDIIELGRKAGVGVVVCNVAVNLRDCAPFASMFRPDLTESQRQTWVRLYQRGIRLQEQGDFEQALAIYREAERTDDQVAELYFRKGLCELRLNNIEAAASDLVLARDLDTLRFRFDSPMSDIVEQVLSRQADSKVRFVDAEAAFAANSPGGVPGRELFYEHVHLTWEGNWLLARTILEQVEPLLPPAVTNAQTAKPTWPSSEDCARRLAWTDRARLECIAEVLGRMEDPPFTHQLNHSEQLDHLRELSEQLARSAGSAALSTALGTCEEAARRAPDDPILQRRLAELRLESGDLEGAVAAARKVAERLPHAPDSWQQLGTTLARGNRFEDAVGAFKTALRLDPDNFWTLNSLARTHLELGQTNTALQEWRRVVAIKPRFGNAYLNIGQVLESQGKTREADQQYRKALENPVRRSAELAALGRLCLAKGWYSQAVTNLQDALMLAPSDASLHLDLARALEVLGRSAEAQPHITAAAQLNPAPVSSHFLLGLELGRQGKVAEAAEHFKEVVRLDPDLVEGHLNLAIALAKQRLTNEALQEFEEVLRRSPTNATALAYVKALEPPAPTPSLPQEPRNH